MIFGMLDLYWYVLPLILVISLVYSASRHESWRLIWLHSLRLGSWIVGVLVLATVVLLLINTQV